MDTSKFDLQINETTHEIKSTVEGMDNFQTPIIEAYIVLLNSVFPEMMRKKVASVPEVVQQIGGEKLSEIKKDFNIFISELPKLCSKILSQSQYWAHRTEVKEGWGRLLAEQAQKQLLDRARSDLTVYFGEILHKHGLINPTSKGGQEWGISANRLYYGYGFTWISNEEKALQHLVKDYSNLFKKYLELSEKKTLLEKNRQEFIATSMWDEA